MEKRTTRKQHYVPQFYLRQWCDDDNGFYAIKIENKIPPKLNVFNNKSGPNRFCYENFFYAQYTGKEDKNSQVIEKAFAEIEAIFATQLPILEDKILKGEQITYADKYNIAECMLFLYFKGKQYREQTKKMEEDLFKQMNRHQMPYIDQIPEMKAKMEELGITKEEMIEFAEKGEYRVELGNLHQLRIMKEMGGFCNLLTAKYWKIYISRTGDFITTDSPYLDIPLSKHFYGNDFLSREQVFILSPRVVVVALNPHNESGKKVNRKDITGNKSHILTINSHNLMNSISFGFHKNRDSLVELEKTIKFLYEYDKSKQ